MAVNKLAWGFVKRSHGLVIGALLASAISCAANSHSQATTLLQTSRTRSAFTSTTYSAALLFREALLFQEHGRCEVALGLYDRLDEEFRQSEYVGPALYNAALCARALGHNDLAKSHFERVVAIRSWTTHAKHARFMLARLAREQGDWLGARRQLEHLLSHRDLSVNERLYVLYQLGESQLHEGDHVGALTRAQVTATFLVQSSARLTEAERVAWRANIDWLRGETYERLVRAARVESIKNHDAAGGSMPALYQQLKRLELARAHYKRCAGYRGALTGLCLERLGKIHQLTQTLLVEAEHGPQGETLKVVAERLQMSDDLVADDALSLGDGAGKLMAAASKAKNKGQ